MMRFFVRSLIVLLVLAGGAVGLSELYPHATAKYLISSLRSVFGLEAKTVDTEVGRVHYLEGGSGPTVVMLHGIYANKDHWVRMSLPLTESYRVIMLDIPGFGDNAPLGDDQYGFDAQADKLVQVLDALKLDKFHLAGNSMGGQLAGMLAQKIPDRILSLGIIGSPAGVKSPTPSDMEKAIARGEAPLLVTDEASYLERMKWLFPRGLINVRPIMRFMIDKEVAQAELNKRIWSEVRASMDVATPLLDLAKEVAAPSLVIWCKEDRIFHFSGAAVLTKALQNGKLVELTGCGHLPYLDQSGLTGDAYRKFLDEVAAGSST